MLLINPFDVASKLTFGSSKVGWNLVKKPVRGGGSIAITSSFLHRYLSNSMALPSLAAIIVRPRVLMCGNLSCHCNSSSCNLSFAQRSRSPYSISSISSQSLRFCSIASAAQGIDEPRLLVPSSRLDVVPADQKSVSVTEDEADSSFESTERLRI